MYLRIYIFIYIYVYMYIYVHVHMYTYMNMYLYMFIHLPHATPQSVLAIPLRAAVNRAPRVRLPFQSPECAFVCA